MEFMGQTGTLTIELSDHNAQITIERPIDPTAR
jgi:hypothetical protein